MQLYTAAEVVFYSSNHYLVGADDAFHLCPNIDGNCF